MKQQRLSDLVGTVDDLGEALILKPSDRALDVRVADLCLELAQPERLRKIYERLAIGGQDDKADKRYFSPSALRP